MWHCRYSYLELFKLLKLKTKIRFYVLSCSLKFQAKLSDTNVWKKWYDSLFLVNPEPLRWARSFWWKIEDWCDIFKNSNKYKSAWIELRSSAWVAHWRTIRYYVGTRHNLLGKCGQKTNVGTNQSSNDNNYRMCTIGADPGCKYR